MRPFVALVDGMREDGVTYTGMELEPRDSKSWYAGMPCSLIGTILFSFSFLVTSAVKLRCEILYLYI